MVTWSVDFDYPTVLLLGLIGVLVVSTVFAMSSSSGAFAPYNQAWDGSSEFRSMARDGSAETIVITNATRYASIPANGSIAVILSPREAYSPAQRSALKQYVRAGGTVLIAEDFGAHSNDLLEAIGASTRLDGRLLRDARNHHRSSALPVTRNLSTHPLLGGVDELTLNYGTAVESSQGRVLVTTSDFGYIDGNTNGKLDEKERLRSYPIMVREEIGAGAVIVVGDPSILINVMLDQPGNRAFAGNLVSQYDRVILDYSHVGALPPIAIALQAVRESALIQFLVGAGIIGVVLLLNASFRLFSRTGPSPEGAGLTGNRQQWMINYLTRNHPDLEEERIRRIANSVLRTPAQSQDND